MDDVITGLAKIDESPDFYDACSPPRPALIAENVSI